ncbi:ilGF domain-containing protein [Trichonephila inaurata madagascariensis]|uniref:IlGF domain-containing protein n=1 Tax=Trichonephila inaurata madagascariensis TaxID=2747483 RepID=A0A8X6MIM0_9ARAC|nr:ilGF domain-containing protein [Trichonephila inaurata madagascariensis]
MQSVRICGKRLADFLHYMCRHYGGFHSPESKRSGNAGNQTMDSILSTVLTSGIVDECCRKQCTLSTLISYCANGEYAESERLREIENLFASHSGTLTENQLRESMMEMMTEQPESANTHLGSNPASDLPNIPNLGTSNRNRPVFIVLPQVYESAGGDNSPEGIHNETENRNSSLTHVHSGSTTQPEESDLSAGIVNECCRKQCTLSTLISYCANGENAANERLSELENLYSSNAEAHRENQMGENTMEIMANNPDSARNFSPETGPKNSTGKTAGTCFIVLPVLMSTKPLRKKLRT